MVRKSRGVADTAVQVFDTLGTFIFQGFDSTGTPVQRNAAYLTAVVESVSAGALAARFELVAGSSIWHFKTNNDSVLPGDIYRGANKLVGARMAGWGVPTGTLTRTTFVTSTVTLPQLAERMAALISDLHATAGHGLLGT